MEISDKFQLIGMFLLEQSVETAVLLPNRSATVVSMYKREDVLNIVCTMEGETCESDPCDDQNLSGERLFKG